MTLPSVAPRAAAAVVLLGALGALHASDPTISSTALVSASREFSMPTGLIIAISSIGAIAQAVTVVSTGMIADRIGRRRLLMIAVATTALGDLIVAAAPHPSVYVIGRLLAGVGLGAVFGSSYAMVRAVSSVEDLPRSMGTFAAVAGAGSILLSFIGGTLITAHWRLSYLLIPILCLVALPLMRRLLPDVAPTASGKFDLPGQITLGLGILGVLLGLSQSSDGWTGPWTIGPIALGLGFLVAFVIRERTTRTPFFPVSVLVEPVFVGALCAGFVYSFGTAVTVLQMANLWQYYTGLSAREVALWQLPFLIASIVASLVTGRVLSRRLRPAATIALGTVLASGGLAYLALVDESLSGLVFLPGMVAVGFGVAVTSLPSRVLVLDTTPPEYFGPVTSSRTAFGQFFYAVGIAVTTTLVTSVTFDGLIQDLEQQGASPARIGTALEVVYNYAVSGVIPTSAEELALKASGAVAYASAFTTVMLVAAGAMLVIGLAGAVLVAYGQRTRVDRTEVEQRSGAEPDAT